MNIIEYNDKYKEGIIKRILDIENNESKINLSLENQPNLLNICDAYKDNGGNFGIVVDNGEVMETIGLMIKDNHCGILRKCFVRADYRCQKIGLSLYKTILKYTKSENLIHPYVLNL